MIVSSRIRVARAQAGLTQTELARRLGIEQGTISRWESGDRTPRLATLYEIARATDKKIGFFLEEVPK